MYNILKSFAILIMIISLFAEVKAENLYTGNTSAFVSYSNAAKNHNLDHSPKINSVLHNGVLTKLPSDWCNGYIVTPAGVELGLTSKNTANAGFVKLMVQTKYSTGKLLEWTAAPMTISVNGVSGDGHILMDTGVDTAYLSPPHEAKLGKLVECKRNSKAECLPKGSVIEVFLPNKTNPVACYTFKIEEEDNLMQPHGVHVLKNPNVFFNSSRHVLGGMNFIYDNTNGYVGYIWNGHSGKHIGYVNPTKIYKN